MKQAKPRVFDLSGAGLKPVVPGSVYMRHYFGSDMSVAFYRMQQTADAPLSAAPHTHGEELAIQLKGGATLQAGDKIYSLQQGDVYLIPPGLEHGGGASGFDGDEVEVLSLVTPARPEFGPEDEAGYFPTPGNAPPPTESKPGDVRILCNLNELSLKEVVPDQLYMQFWHGAESTIAITRMVRSETGMVPLSVNCHPEELCIAFSGRLNMRVEGEAYSFGQGEAFCIPPYMKHDGECVTDECLLLSWYTPDRRAEWGEESDELPAFSFLEE
ncbi:MAG: cupin domain-containing protein [Gammaproteobacteria bacterium]|nr:cupin domain-containing protein [Gammaproteobacteria bacterium]